jgi:hypothetical protein
MGIYQPPINKALGIDHERAKFSDTVIITGDDQELLVPKGAFFLEYLEAETSTTVKLSDGDSVEVVPAISSFNSDHSPMRFDHGIIIDGNVLIAKGYVVRGIFEA